MEFLPIFKERCAVLANGATDTCKETRDQLNRLLLKAWVEVQAEIPLEKRNIGSMVSFAFPRQSKTMKTHGVAHYK